MGTNASTLLRWDQDGLDDCSDADRIWGWSVRSTEVLHHNKDKFDDECLRKMMYLGLLDTKAGAPAWTESLSLKYGVHLVTNMVVRVMQRCFKLDDKVSHPGCLFFDRADRLAF